MTELEYDEPEKVLFSPELDDMGLSVEAYRVYGHLLFWRFKHVDDELPSAESMAQVCRMAEKTVGKALKELVERGMVVLESSKFILTSLPSWKGLLPKYNPNLPSWLGR